jgi:hypothetical protein
MGSALMGFEFEAPRPAECSVDRGDHNRSADRLDVHCGGGQYVLGHLIATAKTAYLSVGSQPAGPSQVTFRFILGCRQHRPEDRQQLVESGFKDRAVGPRRRLSAMGHI